MSEQYNEAEKTLQNLIAAEEEGQEEGLITDPEKFKIGIGAAGFADYLKESSKDDQERLRQIQKGLAADHQFQIDQFQKNTPRGMESGRSHDIYEALMQQQKALEKNQKKLNKNNKPNFLAQFFRGLFKR